MTEDQAQKKWCPLVRAEGGNNVNIETDKGKLPIFRPKCIASDCMMWSWDDPISQHIEKGTYHSAHMATEYPDKYTLCPPIGYCGLTRNQ